MFKEISANAEKAYAFDMGISRKRYYELKEKGDL